MIIDNLVSIFNNLFILFHQIIATLHYLLELNYQLVTVLLDLITKIILTFQLLVDGLKVAITDFIEQYGDFCTSLLDTTIFIVHRIIDSLLTVAVFVLSLFNHLLAGFLLLLRLPEFINEKFESISETTFDIIKLPVSFMNSFFDGLSMIISTIFNGWLYVLSEIFNVFARIVTLFVDSTAFCVTTFARAFIFLLMQPVNAITALFRGVCRVPLEALIGLVICICIFYLFKFGIIRSMIKMWFQLIRKLCVLLFTICLQAVYRARYHLLPLAEMVLMMMVPQLMIVFQVFRIAKRPISIFISCVRVVYDYILRLTGKERLRPVSVPNGAESLNDYGTVENEERLMCIICQDAEKTVMVQPCRHVCMCRECANNVMFDQRRCPMCRSYIAETIDVYL